MYEINWEITKQNGLVHVGTENLPNEVFVAKDNIESEERPKLMKLSVYDKEYAVNLEDGTFFNDGQWMQHPGAVIEGVEHYRLIYFKRIQKLIAEVPMQWADGQGGFTEVGSTQNIHLGFQTTVNGTNHKRTMVILPNGNVSWTSD